MLQLLSHSCCGLVASLLHTSVGHVSCTCPIKQLVINVSSTINSSVVFAHVFLCCHSATLYQMVDEYPQIFSRLRAMQKEDAEDVLFLYKAIQALARHNQHSTLKNFMSAQLLAPQEGQHVEM